MESKRKPGRFIQEFLNQYHVEDFSKAVFGEPIHVEESVIIPVSKLKAGFGYGRGKNASEEQGEGGGLGLVASPVGFIAVSPKKTYFKRIKLHSFVPFIATLTLSGIFLLSYRFLRKNNEIGM